jgi:hypothetical protein
VRLSRKATLTVALKRISGHEKVAAGRNRYTVGRGTHRLAFGRKLRRGRYVATVTARAGSLKSRPVMLKFTVR